MPDLSSFPPPPLLPNPFPRSFIFFIWFFFFFSLYFRIAVLFLKYECVARTLTLRVDPITNHYWTSRRLSAVQVMQAIYQFWSAPRPVRAQRYEKDSPWNKTKWKISHVCTKKTIALSSFRCITPLSITVFSFSFDLTSCSSSTSKCRCTLGSVKRSIFLSGTPMGVVSWKVIKVLPHVTYMWSLYIYSRNTTHLLTKIYATVRQVTICYLCQTRQTRVLDPYSSHDQAQGGARSPAESREEESTWRELRWW